MKYFFVISLFLYNQIIFAQFDHEAVFPDYEGDELLQNVIDNFKPDTVMTFSAAKDALYKDVYQLNDSVSCVYTGFTRYLDPTEDPSQWMYQNGSSLAINAEHNYPKSKGASSGNALSDLFNLYPTRQDVNAARGNLPFNEIPDFETQLWYYLDFNSPSIPGEFIDQYSELGSTHFEPREDHKGNVARSVFYFFTMYNEEAMQADPIFFENMLETLCAWHNEDPVDSLEWQRNEIIASFQSGKRNPFILDCSLAGRLYCSEVSEDCILTSTEKPNENKGWKLYPNPTYNKLYISNSDRLSGKYEITVHNIFGQKQFSSVFDLDDFNDHTFSIECRERFGSNLLLVSVTKLNAPSKAIFRSMVIIQ